MSSYRPRRTRIYGANYDIGESSYKKLLESLDNKRGVGRSTDSHVSFGRETSLPPKVTFSQDEDDFDREKYRASLRAKLQLDDEDTDVLGSTLKQSKLRLAERSRLLDEDEDILGSAYKPLKFKGLDESSAAMETSLKSSLKFRASAEPFESSFKSLKLNGSDEPAFGESIKQRALKAIDRSAGARSILDDLDDQEASTFSSRRIKIRSENVLMGDTSTTTEASSRMKATKARLADLESEMSSISEKQSEREKRKHNLRKLLNESESDSFRAIEM
ncbi:uncharacterized protein LOC101450532 [Ceratitis capitata]|uniref:(Mediterranean fruit fly) hypothetical protein n=1 Tax=Ceratitis capitata TaxID=7213 RepID=W8BZY2_CERCA|nr:uncharacterized protein LOC101450532 [Ceratitis capitata]XP_004523008.1 uncharacterized protein LOC101450532 [Ceratitis capitata]XP_012155974.1 uncharacterized protein LOC101450532 [Ceratitis capitata]CAD7006098.1 unnamed protein product [Ceratitis capitata]